MLMFMNLPSKLPVFWRFLSSLIPNTSLASKLRITYKFANVSRAGILFWFMPFFLFILKKCIQCLLTNVYIVFYDVANGFNLLLIT